MTDFELVKGFEKIIKDNVIMSSEKDSKEAATALFHYLKHIYTLVPKDDYVGIKPERETQHNRKDMIKFTNIDCDEEIINLLGHWKE